MNIIKKFLLGTIFIFLIIFSDKLIFSQGNPISSCGYNITSPGYYYLTNNLTISNGVCINITTNNVIINGNGYSIIGNGGDGIFYNISTNGTSIIDNITIENMNFYNFNNENYSIYFISYSNSTSIASSYIENINLYNLTFYNSTLFIYVISNGENSSSYIINDNFQDLVLNDSYNFFIYDIANGNYTYLYFENNSFYNISLYNSLAPFVIFPWIIDENISYEYFENNNFYNIYSYNSQSIFQIENMNSFLNNTSIYSYIEYNNISNITLYNSNNFFSFKEIPFPNEEYNASYILLSFENNNFLNIYSYNSSNIINIVNEINSSYYGYSYIENNSFYKIYSFRSYNVTDLGSYIENTNIYNSYIGNNNFYCVYPSNQITIYNNGNIENINPTLQSNGLYYYSDSNNNIYECYDINVNYSNGIISVQNLYSTSNSPSNYINLYSIFPNLIENYQINQNPLEENSNAILYNVQINNNYLNQLESEGFNYFPIFILVNDNNNFPSYNFYVVNISQINITEGISFVINESNIYVIPNSNVSIPIYVNDLYSSSSIYLYCLNYPSDIYCSFNNNTISSGQSVNLTIFAQNNIIPGNYSLLLYAYDSQNNINGFTYINITVPPEQINISYYIPETNLYPGNNYSFIISAEDNYNDSLNLSCISTNIPQFNCSFIQQIYSGENTTLNISIPYNISSGLYYIEIMAKDIYTGNSSVENISFNITSEIIYINIQNISSNITIPGQEIYISLYAYDNLNNSLNISCIPNISNLSCIPQSFFETQNITPITFYIYFPYNLEPDNYSIEFLAQDNQTNLTNYTYINITVPPEQINIETYYNNISIIQGYSNSTEIFANDSYNYPLSISCISSNLTNYSCNVLQINNYTYILNVSIPFEENIGEYYLEIMAIDEYTMNNISYNITIYVNRGVSNILSQSLLQSGNKINSIYPGENIIISKQAFLNVYINNNGTEYFPYIEVKVLAIGNDTMIYYNGIPINYNTYTFNITNFLPNSNYLLNFTFIPKRTGNTTLEIYAYDPSGNLIYSKDYIITSNVSNSTIYIIILLIVIILIGIFFYFYYMNNKGRKQNNNNQQQNQQQYNNYYSYYYNQYQQYYRYPRYPPYYRR